MYDINHSHVWHDSPRTAGTCSHQCVSNEWISLFKRVTWLIVITWWGLICVTFMNEPPSCLYNKRYTKKSWGISHKRYTKKWGRESTCSDQRLSSMDRRDTSRCGFAPVHPCVTWLIPCWFAAICVWCDLETPSYVTWFMTCWFICCMLRSHVWHALDTRAGAVSHRFAGRTWFICCMLIQHVCHSSETRTAVGSHLFSHTWCDYLPIE